MECRLQVFKVERGVRDSGVIYRFAIVDYSRSRSYPANFVCMLPAKVELGKGKAKNVFGGLFGDKSQDFAVELLNKALIGEKDDEVKTEIKRRLKLIDPKQVSLVKCGRCNRNFQACRTRKYKQNLCPECLTRRYARKINP